VIDSHVITYSLKLLRDTVEEYHRDWRHPDLDPPSISDVYNLFPDQPTTLKPSHNWPDAWPQGDWPGVYLIYSDEFRLSYIGKSALLGVRLSHYFRYSAGPKSTCRIVHAWWRTKPTYVVTVAVLNSFEAPSLEEFLIPRLNPLENWRWSMLDPARFDCPE
jgi:hypothetical protein